MKLFILRHTEVGVDPGICYGASDIPLAETFEAEAADLLGRLAGKGVVWDTVYVSPLSRCQKLAHKLHPDPITHDGLIEFDFGDWELKPWGEITDAGDWFADFVNTKAPGGEAFIDLYARVERFWAEVIEPARATYYAQPKGERGKRPTMAVVTHAGVIRAFLALVLEMPLKNTFNVTVDKGGIVEMTLRASHVQVEVING